MSILVKLGKKASSFYDPATLVALSGRDVVEITDNQAKSLKVVRALGGGHLVRATKFELQSFQNFLKESTPGVVPVSTKDTDKLIASLKEQLANKIGENAELKQQLSEVSNQEISDEESAFDSMGDEELVEYYKSNYQISAKELKAFEKLETSEKITELKSLEEVD
jgi:hypothetical protein